MIEKIAKTYLAHIAYVNNWDLVDCSADQVLGPYFQRQSKAPLYRMARSRNLWRRRIAMLTTFWWIKQGKFTDALRVAQMLLHDKEDLIHKAVGWMLREVGKRSRDAEEAFLLKHYHIMPRTMLTGTATYADGRWRLVVMRPLRPAVPDGAALMLPGRFNGVAFAVVDGDNGAARAVSPWVELALPKRKQEAHK